MQILGITIGNYKYKDFFKKISNLKQKSIIFTPNPEIILKTLEDKKFKEMLLNADYLIPDGTGLFIAYQINDLKSKFKNYKLKIILSYISLPIFIFNAIFRKGFIHKKYGDKICGSDLTFDLIDFSQKNNIEITILDLYNPNDKNKLDSQKVFSSKIKENYPNLSFKYIIYDESKKDKILKNIKSSSSKIIFSTLGMKKQEKSIIEIMGKCNNLKLGLGVGSSFDYIVGFQKRAPLFWRKLGLEWFYRLITGPQKIKRLKRLWNAIFVFIYYVIKEK